MIVSILLSACVLILSVLGLGDIMPVDITNSIAIPMLGIIMLVKGLVNFRKNKFAGIINLLCAGFIFVCCIIVFIR